MMTRDGERNIYWVDRKMRIISVGGRWDEFALENEGADVLSEEIQGRPIWQFVTGDATRMWLETLFQLTHVTGRSTERPYRCDSPGLRRYMHMTIIPETSGVLRVEHDLLSTEERTLPVYAFSSRTSSKKAVSRCSICGRVSHAGVWVEPDRYIESRAEVEGDHLNVVYTVCEECFLLLP